jgi:hypothetical protein
LPVEQKKVCWRTQYHKLLKNVKEHSVQQAQFLLSNHRVVLPWCTKALAFIELKVDNVISQGFNVSFSVHHFVNSLLWQKC